MLADPSHVSAIASVPFKRESISSLQRFGVCLHSQINTSRVLRVLFYRGGISTVVFGVGSISSFKPSPLTLSIFFMKNIYYGSHQGLQFTVKYRLPVYRFFNFNFIVKRKRKYIINCVSMLQISRKTKIPTPH